MRMMWTVRCGSAKAVLAVNGAANDSGCDEEERMRVTIVILGARSLKAIIYTAITSPELWDGS
jgi:hypothetical protein